MGKYIRLDLGTTSISGLILDTESKAVLLHRTISNNSEITTPEGKNKGYSEWEIEQMAKLAYNLLSDLAKESDCQWIICWNNRCTKSAGLQRCKIDGTCKIIQM